MSSEATANTHAAGPREVRRTAPERDYSGRSLLDKLGVRAGQALAFDERGGWGLDSLLRAEALERAGRAPAAEGEPVDVVLLAADDTTDLEGALRTWRTRLAPGGSVWVLTPKRGQPGYVNQDSLIPRGLAAGLVDNKVCSVSVTTSGLRFVIRRADRGAG